jgi:hypothetical protein
MALLVLVLAEFPEEALTGVVGEDPLKNPSSMKDWGALAATSLWATKTCEQDWHRTFFPTCSGASRWALEQFGQ